MFYLIGLLSLFYFPLFSSEHIYLKTPSISQHEITGVNVGIRPYRKTGVRIETELLKDKFIIHNYGYGGSGLTLSFGGTKEVLDILDKQKTSSKTVAVLGAGVIGLATAYDLLEKGYEVHLYSSQWSPDLPSNVAAGIWSPLRDLESSSISIKHSEEQKKLHQRMLETAEQRFLKSTSDDPEFAGVRLICSYSLKKSNPAKAINGERKGEDITIHFDNGLIKNGRKIYELGLDGKLFIEDLYAKVKSNGAILHQKYFESIEDLLNLKESTIINCMSMGSRELFNDQEFIPVKGHVIYFKPQDGVDYLLYQSVPNNSNSWVSIYPWSDRLILGGVYEYAEESLSINPKIVDEIIQNAEKCLSGNL